MKFEPKVGSESFNLDTSSFTLLEGIYLVCRGRDLVSSSEEVFVSASSKVVIYLNERKTNSNKVKKIENV